MGRWYSVVSQHSGLVTPRPATGALLPSPCRQRLAEPAVIRHIIHGIKGLRPRICSRFTALQQLLTTVPHFPPCHPRLPPRRRQGPHPLHRVRLAARPGGGVGGPRLHGGGQAPRAPQPGRTLPVLRTPRHGAGSSVDRDAIHHLPLSVIKGVRRYCLLKWPYQGQQHPDTVPSAGSATGNTARCAPASFLHPAQADQANACGGQPPESYLDCHPGGPGPTCLLRTRGFDFRRYCEEQPLPHQPPEAESYGVQVRAAKLDQAGSRRLPFWLGPRTPHLACPPDDLPSHRL